MQITYACPECRRTSRVEVPASGQLPACGQCHTAAPAETSGTLEPGHLSRCLVCGSPDLFVRKDFPQRLGVAIVVLGFAASCVAWARHEVAWTFGILFATAAIDVVLYLIVGNALECYRCAARYHQVPDIDQYEAFDLTTHERYRQLAARLAQSPAAGGSERARD